MSNEAQVINKNRSLRYSLVAANNFISRLLGAAYIIPWYIWMGKHGAEANGLFTITISTLGLLISAAGVPVAVSLAGGQVQYQEAENWLPWFVASLSSCLLLGLVLLLSCMCSPVFANLSGGGKDLIPVMPEPVLGRSCFPSMKLSFVASSGHNNLKPYAISQIAEQKWFPGYLDALDSLLHYEGRLRWLRWSCDPVTLQPLLGWGSLLVLVTIPLENRASTAQYPSPRVCWPDCARLSCGYCIRDNSVHCDRISHSINHLSQDDHIAMSCLGSCPSLVQSCWFSCLPGESEQDHHDFVAVATRSVGGVTLLTGRLMSRGDFELQVSWFKIIWPC